MPEHLKPPPAQSVPPYRPSSGRGQYQSIETIWAPAAIYQLTFIPSRVDPADRGTAASFWLIVGNLPIQVQPSKGYNGHTLIY